MKLRKLTQTEILERVTRSFQNEIKALEDKLSREFEKRPLRSDVFALNSMIESLQQRMAETSEQTSGRISNDFAHIAQALTQIDTTDDVNILQEQIRDVKKQMYLIQNTETTNEPIEFLLEEIKRLEERLNNQPKHKFMNAALPTPLPTLKLYSQGELITSNATCINFQGDVSITPSKTIPGCYDITTPAIITLNDFNQNDFKPGDFA